MRIIAERRGPALYTQKSPRALTSGQRQTSSGRRSSTASVRALRDAAVLEVFAGTGRLKVWSASVAVRRGPSASKSRARHAQFMHGKISRWRRCPKPRWHLRIQDALSPPWRKLAAASQKFDLLLADPPYGEKNVNRRSTSFAQQLLDNARSARTSPARRAVHPRSTPNATRWTFRPLWHESKMLKHGDTVMRFLKIIPQ